jgi:isopentenyldiphosphate isomerase
MITPNELLFVVNEQNQPIEPKSRHEAHTKGYWHRVAHIWIYNSRNEILVQQRSWEKDSNPGMWEPFFGGHIPAGRDYTEAALDELREELHLEPPEEEFTFLKIFKNETGKEFVYLFTLKWDRPVDASLIEKEEIQTIEWQQMATVKEQATNVKNTQWSHIGHEKEVIELLQKK